MCLTISSCRESVVQATKSARSNALKFYIGVLLAVLFFGGFLAKSYWEEYTFNRDVKKLLAYYKHVLPGSIADGDEHNAMVIVWKYRHKKQKLWDSLERKYLYAVREVDEWEGFLEEKAKAGENEGEMEENLDEQDEVNDESSAGGEQEL